MPRGKIEKLLIFLDHVIELNENETESLAFEITQLIEKEGPDMSLSFKDTSFAKYHKRIGNEEGREEGIILAQKEVARKMLLEGYPVEDIMKVTDLSKEEIKELRSGKG